MLPLDGIRILDLTRLIPGAFCTSILADLGAEVIKIEEPKIGDYGRQIRPLKGSISYRFLLLNRNKKSFALNLKEKAGRDIFLELVKRSDVVIEGFRPGVVQRLKIDYESLKDVNKKIIYCSISSFGQSGPYRDTVAHDINILGETGFFEITGIPDGPPVIPGIQIADIISSFYAIIGILISLINREKTDAGQFIDISMFDGMFSLLFDSLSYLFSGERVPERGKGRLWGGLSNYNLYETKDNRYIAVGCLENKFKKTLFKELGMDSLSPDDQNITTEEVGESEEDLIQSLKKIFLKKPLDEWIRELGRLNICISPANSLSEAVYHPQVRARKMIVETQHPDLGKLNLIGFPIKFSDIEVDPTRFPAPKLGQHTEEILMEIGYSDNQIMDLKEKRIIG